MPRRPRTLVLAAGLALAALAGCIGAEDVDPAATDGADAEDPREAAFNGTELPDTITGVNHELTLGPDAGLESGYQVALDGSLAYISAWNAGVYTVDVSQPTQPEVLGHVADTFGHDPWVLEYANRTVVANAATSQGIDFIDVTDPERPQILATVLGTNGTTDTEGANVHNIAVVPNTTIVYNSRSVDTPAVDIVDASDPEEPEVLGQFNDVTCHDIAFHPSEERAFCAGVRETQIWDVSEPTEPEIVTRIHNPAINIHHWAIPAHDGDTLIIGDELGGAAHEAFNGCLGASADDPAGGQATDPVGALWFYDISDPQQPVLQSWISASEMRAETGACTAHFGETVEDRNKLVLGFLSGGVYTVDIADPTAPAMVDHAPVGEVVDVQVKDGYAFGVGRDRGMDVFTFAGE